MSSAARFSHLLEVLQRNLDSNRLAHAFIVEGDPHRAGREFADVFLQMLFCEGLTKPCGDCRECRKVTERNHPDIAWLEPQKKSRTFDLDKQIRPMLHDLAQTSFQGGWKAVVLVEADSLNDAQANAILKGLEEPGARRMWLLLTNHADHLLPTIRSRCQRLTLPNEPCDFIGDWVMPLRQWLEQPAVAGGIPALADAAMIKGLIDAEKKRIEKGVKAESDKERDDDEVIDARVKSELIRIRSQMLEMITLWQRDVLALASGGSDALLHFRDGATPLRQQAAALGVAGALDQLRRTATLVRRLDRNIPEGLALESMLLR